jgi:uncharacterized protein (TIGR02145 family)
MAKIILVMIAVAAFVFVNCGDGMSDSTGGMVDEFLGGFVTRSETGDGGTLTDSRDGKKYRTVTIGTQTWMAENLNFNASGSACYDNIESNCNTYGRLYDWNTVMAGSYSSSSSPSGVRGICPAGWHVPSDAEWEILVKYVDPNASGNYDNVAGTKLKSATGWEYYSSAAVIVGTDDFGFSALPGGYGNGSNFGHAGNYGLWWSATELDATDAWFRSMDYRYGNVDRDWHYKTNLSSLRCARD